MEDPYFEVVTKYHRCKEKGFRCFAFEAAGQCIGCTVVDAECTVFVSEEKWEKVQREGKEQQLVVARLEALLGQKKWELLRTRIRQRSYADRDKVILDELNRAKERAKQSKKAKKAKQAKESSTLGKNLAVCQTVAIRIVN